MKKPIFILALASLLFAGCLTRDLSEGNSVLSNDVEEVFAASDFFLEGNDSTATVRITSNRSWSAHLNDLDNPVDEAIGEPVPWGYLSTEDHPNLTNATDVVDLKVTFRRNYSKTPVNGVLKIYSEGGLKKTISLKQAGVKYYLDASCATLDPSDEGEEVVVNVACNTKWNVEIKKGATADAILERPEGVDHYRLKLRFKENEEKVKKNLTLKFSAPECNPVELNFVQSESRSDIPVLEGIYKLISNGKATYALMPRLIAEKALDLGTGEAVQNVKYYYKISEKGFDDIDTPTVEDPEIPEDGITLLTETTSTGTYVKMGVNPLRFIKILAVAEGYRKSYEQIILRSWLFGSKLDDLDGMWGVGSSSSVNNFPLEYYGLTFTKNGTTNSGWSYRFSLQQGTDVTTPPDFGTRGAMYVRGNASNGSDVYFYIGETSLGTKNIKCTSSAPQDFASETGIIGDGDLFKMSLPNAALQTWIISVMEQKKYKP